MEYILLAIGLVLVLEGLVYALAPSIIEELLAALKTLTIEQRRMVGLGACALGAVFLWIASGLGI